MSPETIRAAVARNKALGGYGPHTLRALERELGWSAGNLAKYLDGSRMLTEDVEARIRAAFDPAAAAAAHAEVARILE